MKETITCHCLAALGALILSGCGLTGEANSVKDPTVDQMADLEKQWGLKPRETRPRYSPDTDPSPSAPSPASFAQPQATEPVPFPSAPVTPAATIPSPPPETPPIPPSLR